MGDRVTRRLILRVGWYVTIGQPKTALYVEGLRNDICLYTFREYITKLVSGRSHFDPIEKMEKLLASKRTLKKVTLVRRGESQEAE